MQLSKLIDSRTLNAILQKSSSGIRVLDCTYNRVIPPQLADAKKFKAHFYGKFDDLLKLPSPHREIYLKSHIPTAVHIDMNLAMYPGDYETFAIYEPDVFERYVQLLGVNRDEHLVLYGRGPFGGMLWPSKVYWLFKTYGHHQVSLLNGGFEDWMRSQLLIETLEKVPDMKKGDWKAKDRRDLNVTYEEMVQNEPEKSTDLNELSKKANIFDARPRNQYQGVDGCYIPGTKNVPSNELIDENGYIKEMSEIDRYLKEANYDPQKPSITMCNTGIQASLLSFVLEEVHPKVSTRLYNGSLKEMEVRDPRRISGRSEKGMHL